MEQSRFNRQISEERGRKRTSESSEGNVPKQKRAITSIEKVFEDSARYLGVFDTDLILSWTPKEYRAFLKGAQYRQIDDYEYMAKSAMAIGYASRAKRPKEKRIFDAKRMRKKLETGQDYDLEQMKRSSRLNKALKGFEPNFIPKKKGG
ncbi:hypothetical protein [Ornithinibacillus xuwenensis]|uniref:Uncharacterized protein n=1 Tax=Ornithinibacillus xuwenensis TaxID=3144668 RepID=A0ABU9XG38_9BACI